MIEITPQDEESSKVVKEKEMVDKNRIECTKNVLFLDGKKLNEIRLSGIAVLIDGFRSGFIVDMIDMSVYKCSATTKSLENVTRKAINSLSTVIDYNKEGFINRDELARFWVSEENVYITCVSYNKLGRVLKIGQRLVVIKGNGGIDDSVRELAVIKDPEGYGFDIDLVGYDLEKNELCLGDKTERSLELIEPCSEILYITGTSIEMTLRITLQKNGIMKVSTALV